MWCGSESCEEGIRQATAMKPRCIPFERERISESCVCCGQPASDLLYWGYQY